MVWHLYVYLRGLVDVGSSKSASHNSALDSSKVWPTQANATSNELGDGIRANKTCCMFRKRMDATKDGLIDD